MALVSIRTATADDWDEVADKVLDFNNHYYGIPVDLDKLEHWFASHMQFGVILLSKRGFISGLFVDDPVRHWSALAETGWFDPGLDGVRLLDAFIALGKDKVDEVRMTTLHTSPQSADRLLKRRGFETIEFSHRLLM